MSTSAIEQALDGYELDARVIWYSEGEGQRNACALRKAQVNAARAELTQLRAVHDGAWGSSDSARPAAREAACAADRSER